MIDIKPSEAARADLIDIWNSIIVTWDFDQAGSYLDASRQALNGLVAGCSAITHVFCD